jgi:hypothetical protein
LEDAGIKRLGSKETGVTEVMKDKSAKCPGALHPHLKTYPNIRILNATSH